MSKIYGVRIGLYVVRMQKGKKVRKNFMDLYVRLPLRQNGGKFTYGNGRSMGDDFSGTYKYIRDGVYDFDLPKGVSASGVHQYGESGRVVLTGLRTPLPKGGGEAEVYGGGVTNPPGVRWVVEQKDYAHLE